ncbi:MAG: hypothetical protein WCE79_19290 [Xanthobacteraceae bacterium]
MSQLTEVWDQAQSYPAARMEMQIKRAIFCELRRGAVEARRINTVRNTFRGKNVTTADDIPLADSWGAQVSLTITADEKSTLTPSLLLKNPLAPAAVFGEPVAQSYTTAIGGALSSQNVRYDKFDFYYTVADLVNHAGPGDGCHGDPPAIQGSPSTSSPFVNPTQLGIFEWLPGAVAVTTYQRSSRAALSGEGPALGGDSFSSDAITYSNKFVIISSANVAPVWDLVRVGTGTSPLFDANRTRTHELLITIGPGSFKLETEKSTGRKRIVSTGPSRSARDSHFASQIGSAVATAVRPRN